MNMPHSNELPPIKDLVIHGAPMLLIDRAVSADETKMTAELDITANSMFCVPGKGVPSYVGVEYIAQTVAAYSGWRARQAHQRTQPRIGYLLGSRKVTMLRDFFPVGSRLTVHITNVFEDGEMGVFDGEVRLGEEILVDARINVYQPKENETASTPPVGNNQETSDQ